MPDILQLTIVHTNDIHSHFEQMPGVAETIDRLRLQAAKEGTPFLAVDCGDHMDRVRLETEGSGGMANVEVMSATGYDLVVPGNNEGLTLSRGNLESAYATAPFAVLAGNLFEAETDAMPSFWSPTYIWEADGVRTGFIGVTAFYPDFYRLLGWDVRDPVEIVRYWASRMREQVDILVLLSHLGLSNDERIAREMFGIDLILGGHTHHLLERLMKVEDTYIGAAGKFGQYVGEVRLIYDRESKRLVEANGFCHAVEAGGRNHPVAGIIRKFRERALDSLSESVACLSEPLSIDWSKESPLGNLAAAGLRRWTGAEIGVVNAGQMLQSLRAGSVTKAALLELCPSPVNPCRIRLLGKHLMQALEESLLPEFVGKAIFGYGFRGKRLGTLCLDGITIVYDDQAEPYAKIRSVRVGEEPLDPERDYVVGMIDMFTFGAGYLSLKLGTDVQYFVPEFLRDVLAQELVNAHAVEACKEHRWHPVLPSD